MQQGFTPVSQPVSRSTHAMVPLGASEFRWLRAARGQPLRVDLDTGDAGEACSGVACDAPTVVRFVKVGVPFPAYSIRALATKVDQKLD